MGIWSASSTIFRFAVALCIGSSEASAEDCSLALVLAMDASKSMSSADFNLQFQGTAAALRSEEIQRAILAQAPPVALIAFEWSGQKHQRIIHDWSVLRSRENIETFADSLERHERGGLGQKTGTGSALAFSYDLLESGPNCTRKVIDLSSDGYSSDGMTPAEFYDGSPPADVTVNALVIGGASNPYKWRYFTSEVLHGPGAFGLSIDNFQDYPRAIKEKLLRELTPPRFSGDPHLPFSVN